MMNEGSGSASQGEVEEVARVLLLRGSVREGVAMLRGAVIRDREEDRCRSLLERVLAGERPEAVGYAVELDLSLVDRWIRSGKLVEALALLGGTPMGSVELGREWANLLGELLAPVPVDADEKLVQMQEELMSGGASVALMLLEERALEAPPIPSWAHRRLELLRWMLLDNASVAEDQPLLPNEVTTGLAGAIREPLHQRSLPEALVAARRFADAHRTDGDARRTVQALEALLTEIGLQAELAENQHRTIPIFGRPAAALQLRMGNLAHAVALYDRLLEKHPEDEGIARLRDDVGAVLRARDGRPIPGSGDATPVEGIVHEMSEDWVDDDNTLSMERYVPDPERALSPASFEAALGAIAPPAPEVEPEASEPEASAPAEPSFATELSRPPVDLEPTQQMPNAGVEVDRLVAEGRLEEAENICRGFARLFPDEPEHLRRAEALRAQRLGGGSAEGVLTHEIRQIK